jgi:hypothetical protein
MDGLLSGIKRARSAHTNFEKRHFIPEAALIEVISEPSVKCSLRSVGVPFHEVADLTGSILRGARKCFAILILIGHGREISGFFRHDSMQKSSPDERLPYSLETLLQIFEKDATSLMIQDFLERQWEVAIPIMHQNMICRELDTRAILPFLCEESAGQGSMGTAWKIELHPECHQLPLESHKASPRRLIYLSHKRF